MSSTFLVARIYDEIDEIIKDLNIVSEQDEKSSKGCLIAVELLTDLQEKIQEIHEKKGVRK